jgi:hypothetical protein
MVRKPLDRHELVYLEDFQRAFEPITRQLENLEFVEGMKMFRAVPPEEQVKYEDWTPRQFYAMKLLIDEFKEREEDPSARSLSQRPEAQRGPRPGGPTQPVRARAALRDTCRLGAGGAELARIPLRLRRIERLFQNVGEGHSGERENGDGDGCPHPTPHAPHMLFHGQRECSDYRLFLGGRIDAEDVRGQHALPEFSKPPRRDQGAQERHRDDEQTPRRPSKHLRGPILEGAELRPERNEPGHLGGRNPRRTVFYARNGLSAELKQLPRNENRPPAAEPTDAVRVHCPRLIDVEPDMATALDNGQRSPRKLLASVVRRLCPCAETFLAAALPQAFRLVTLAYCESMGATSLSARASSTSRSRVCWRPWTLWKPTP